MLVNVFLEYGPSSILFREVLSDWDFSEFIPFLAHWQEIGNLCFYYKYFRCSTRTAYSCNFASSCSKYSNTVLKPLAFNSRNLVLFDSVLLLQMLFLLQELFKTRIKEHLTIFVHPLCVKHLSLSFLSIRSD